MARSYVLWKEVEDALEAGQANLSTLALVSLVRNILIPIASEASKDAIATQRAPSGKKWRPLKDSTMRVRAGLRHLGIGPAAPINKRTGALERFLQEAGTELVVGDGIIQGAWPALISQDSTRLMYAFHTAQGGSSRWRTPARPVVGLAPTSIGLMDGMMRVYVDQLFQADNVTLGLAKGNIYKA